MNFKQIFHYVSYLQYPLMLVGTYYAIYPYIYGFDTLWVSLNNLLVFMGLGISFSTLQDTSKTQNEFSKKVWESPKKGKRMLILLSFLTAFVLLIGIIGYFSASISVLKELSFGTIVLGIGLMGMLKAAAEMAENHRKQ